MSEARQVERVVDAVDEWLAPGRKTIEGYMHGTRGRWKKDYGLLGNHIVRIMEEAGQAHPPRYRDLHTVWFGFDPEGEKGHQLLRPFLRYKAFRSIDGLSLEHNNHRVRLTCTVTERWSNGLGAYIVRAHGECIECGEA